MRNLFEKNKNLIRASVFLLLLSFVCLNVLRIFKNNDTRFYQTSTVLYEENPGSLDAVYIGASNVHCFWIPVSAWQNHGISVLSYTSNNMPVAAWPYMIEEVRKTQPEALIILNLNPFKPETGQDQVKIHRIADFMPFSLNKVNMINGLADAAGIGFEERMEFFFPFLRFHSKWASLTPSDFHQSKDGIKSGLIYIPHWRYSMDLSGSYIRYTGENDLTEKQGQDLIKLLDYLEQKHPNVLFITVPQAIEDRESIGRINKVGSILREHGYTWLNLLNEPESIALSLSDDFYDKEHTNVHGALKYTEFLSRYLIENYGFTDKRGEPGWESWDQANERYNGFIKPYTLPFEREAAPRDITIPAPEHLAAKEKNGEITVTWETSPGAEGYRIYRKSEETGGDEWREFQSVSGDILTVTDNDITHGTELTYTVVPLCGEGEAEVFGDFSYKGISVMAD